MEGKEFRIMITSQELKNEIEKLFADPGFFEQHEREAVDWIHRIYEPFITQVAQDALNRAAENARSCVVGSLSSAMREDMEKFITNTEIILP